jgi:hypothetical protein
MSLRDTGLGVKINRETILLLSHRTVEIRAVIKHFCKLVRNFVFTVIAVSMLLGCEAREVAELRQRFVLSSEPAEALSVLAARALIAESPEPRRMAVFGRIGSDRHETWQTGQASFLIWDESVKAEAHHDHGEDDDCPFCRARKQNELKAIGLVEFVDESGNTVQVDARSLFRARGGESIVVNGLATKDPLGNLVVKADGIFFRR